jgi:hypothetical protein
MTPMFHHKVAQANLESERMGKMVPSSYESRVASKLCWRERSPLRRAQIWLGTSSQPGSGYACASGGRNAQTVRLVAGGWWLV